MSESHILNEANSQSQMENPFEQERVRNEMSDEEDSPSRMSFREQDNLNQIKPQQDEEVEYENRLSPHQDDRSDLQFGHDDLEFQAPLGPIGDDSIYSHKTSTILDEEKVSFMHIEHMANQEDQSDDSFSEQDMVYYNKDDLTQYSKNLGLNKVKAKINNVKGGGNYFSENDLQEVSENSENGEREGQNNSSIRLQNSQRTGRSYEPGTRNGISGEGRIQHNNVSIEDHGEYVDGRLKVDSWNLNYTGKKKKLRKKKVTKEQKKKMNNLQNIYGIDAATLAGLSKGRLPKRLIAAGKFGKDDKNGNDPGQFTDHDQFRSTQNTFAPKSQLKSIKKSQINDNQSNMFSFNGNGTDSKWKRNDDRDKLLSSQQDNLNSKFGENENDKRKLKGKMTSTQQRFGDNLERRDSSGDSNGFQNKL